MGLRWSGIEEGWTLHDLITHLRGRGGQYELSLDKKYIVKGFVNETGSYSKTKLKNRDIVRLLPMLSRFSEGLDEASDVQKYVSITAATNESAREIPDSVLPGYTEGGTGEAPDGWKHELYPQLYLDLLKKVKPEKTMSFTHLAGNVPETELFEIGPCFRLAWEKLDKDIVGALRDGLKYVKIKHGGRSGEMNNRIRHWLIGCDWVLAYSEGRDSSGVVIVELKHPNNPL